MKNITGNMQAVFGIQREKSHILHQEVHLQKPCSSPGNHLLCFSVTEFISVASENDKGNQLKKNDGGQGPRIPCTRTSGTGRALLRKMNAAVMDFIPEQVQGQKFKDVMGLNK